MADRRSDARAASPDRRSFPRPPLWLNLLLLVVAAATFVYAQHHRRTLDRENALLFQRPVNTTSPEVSRIRSQLSAMDLTEAQLAKELDSKLAQQQVIAKMLEGEEFYLAIDSSRQRLSLRLGKEVVRDCPVEIGAARTIGTPGGKSWTFVPLKGAFNVTGKQQNYAWRIPDWVYVLNGATPPAERAVVPNALGTYVLFLPNDYVIATPPAADSPLHGPKPGSFVIPEADMAAIWPRITTQTRVYVF